MSMRSSPNSLLATSRANAYGWALMLAAPVLTALAAIALGKEAGWDLQNYHWYSPYALMHGRLGFDIAVAHHATYYNPLLDIPLYWLGTHGPAWWVGAFQGALFGVMVALQGAIAYQVIGYQVRRVRAHADIGHTGIRIALATLIAVCGSTGAGAILALGDSASVVPAAIGIFVALWILLRHFAQLSDAQMTQPLALLLLLAGVSAGISAGLKLTTDTFAVGLLVATFITPKTWTKRFIATTLLGVGMLCGFIAVAGWWLWRMWEYGRNPLFPYFNQWFHSPLLVEGSYLDLNFIDASTSLEKWWLPWYIAKDSYRVSEMQFSELRILIAYALVLIASVYLLVKARMTLSASKSSTPFMAKPSSSVDMPAAIVTHPGMAKFLFCFAAVSYLTWLQLFCVYRYLVPLEMLAPLLIVVAVLSLPLTRAMQVCLLLGLWLGMQSALNVHPLRQSWRGNYVSVDLPPLARTANSMVLMSGTAPMAFVIPSFSAEIRFLRIDGWMVHRQDTSSGLARQMRAAVAAHQGSLLMLFAPGEQQGALLSAQYYGLRLIESSCASITSNIAAPLRLCLLTR